MTKPFVEDVVVRLEQRGQLSMANLDLVIAIVVNLLPGLFPVRPIAAFFELVPSMLHQQLMVAGGVGGIGLRHERQQQGDEQCCRAGDGNEIHVRAAVNVLDS